MLHTYICILACFNHFHGIYNGNETINIAHWNMKPGFAYKCPHPCTATERHSPSILLLKNEPRAPIHKSSSKPCIYLQLRASTSRVVGSRRNHSFTSLSKGTKQFCYSEDWPQKSSPLRREDSKFSRSMSRRKCWPLPPLVTQHLLTASACGTHRRRRAAFPLGDPEHTAATARQPPRHGVPRTPRF